MTKETIMANLERAIELIEGTPEELVSLDSFTYTTECGTLHCTYGWLASDPYFQALGVTLENGQPYLTSIEEYVGGCGFFSELDNLFGENSYDALFTSFGNSCFDPHDLKGGHKAAALHRLRRQLWLVEESYR